MSHSARSAWIETSLFYFLSSFSVSHSARSAWIETGLPPLMIAMYHVALRKECVD